MAAVKVIAPEKNPQDEEAKAFVYGQCLLTKSLSSASPLSDCYHQLVSTAQGAPFCVLDASETKEGEAEGKVDHATNAVLNTVLPQNSVDLAPTVIAILSDQPPERKVFTVIEPESPNDPTVMETLLLLTPTWSTPTFEVFYVNVQSHKAPPGLIARLTNWHEEKYRVNGTCHCSQFTMNTQMLVQHMKKKEDADTDIASYLSSALGPEPRLEKSMNP